MNQTIETSIEPRTTLCALYRTIGVNARAGQLSDCDCTACIDLLAALAEHARELSYRVSACVNDDMRGVYSDQYADIGADIDSLESFIGDNKKRFDKWRSN